MRLESLDVFRGLTIAGMLLVNNPGSWSHVYAPLRHAAWNGCTPTDLIFPWFLFIVGVAATFSLGGLTARGIGRLAVFRKVAVRAAVIFALGLALAAVPAFDLGHLRLLGVLQRIALSYFVAATIMLCTGIRGQAAALVAVLAGYWALLTLVPVPGVGPGVLAPGLNLSNWLDARLIGPNHVWRATAPWDPEGILSTLGALASVLCGVLAGHWIRSPRPAATKARGLLGAGVAGVCLGLAWNLVFPLNKNLWTGSYVLYTGGLACLLLAPLYWIVDLRGYRRWERPFLVFGTNAITAYWLSSLVAIIFVSTRVTRGAGSQPIAFKTYLYEALFASWLTPTNASLAYATAYVLLWLGLLTILYRRRIFIRI